MVILNNKVLLVLCVIFALGINNQAHAQSVDLENFYKPNFKVTGVVNANMMYYNSNYKNSLTPFTYLLSGNLNISAFSFNVPLFYSLTNQGNKLGYATPFDFNRLSIMPKYKCVKAFIGNASMTFSPYTLSGFPFKGLGLELTPEGPFKISLMGGQLLKAVDADEGYGGVPVYQRFGYGTKIEYEQAKYKLGWIGFYAKDNQNSLPIIEEDKGVTPKENFVNSLTLNTSLLKNLTFTGEYALSILTDDSRAQPLLNGSLTDKLFGVKESTSFFNAYNFNFDYTIQKSVVGVTYERIDPNYSTLGALYFNNDLENIALRFSRPFYKDKIMLSTSLGFQRDDLANEKKQNTSRVVGSINMNYKISDQINFTGNYSNFSTYTNKKLDQFELINNPDVVPADTLDYRQLSQNANFNLSYVLGKKKNQNLNLNYSIAGQANEQGGVIRKGQASTVQNYNIAHTVNFKASKIILNSSLNYTNNQVSLLNNSSVGASVGASKKLFKEKLNTNFGVLYNTSQSEQNASSVYGFRLNNSIVLLDQHNFSVSVISMFRSDSRGIYNNDLNATLNYSYSLEKIKLPGKGQSTPNNKVTLEPVLKINYKKETYEGTRNEIVVLLNKHQLELPAIPEEDLKNVEHLIGLVDLTPDDKSFKAKALEYLEAFDANSDIFNRYNNYILESVKSLQLEMLRKDEIFEKYYFLALGLVNSHKLHGVKEKDISNKMAYKSYLKLVERKDKKERSLQIHRWMLNEISVLAVTPKDSLAMNENLSNFNKQELSHYFKIIKENKSDSQIIENLKIKLILFYDDLGRKNAINDAIEFKNIR